MSKSSLLTDAKIRGLKAEPGKQAEHGDSLVPGLRLRVSGQSKSWILRQRAGGKVRTITIGKFGDGTGGLTLAAARTKAVALKAEIDRGVIPMPASPRPSLAEGRIRDLVDRFMAEYCVDKAVKRPEAYRWQFDKYVIPRFGDWTASAVRRADLREALREIRENHGLTTARRVGGLLKRFFRWTVGQDAIDADPMAALDLPGSEVVRERTLSDAEIKAIWLATDPSSASEERHPSRYPWGAYFRLLLLLGQRRGEIAAMRWSSLDLDKGTWSLESGETKSARAHLVPLPRAAVDLLRSLPRLGHQDGGKVFSDWVFTTNGRTPISGFGKAKIWLDDAMKVVLRKEGDEVMLAGWRVHDIRRSVATNLAKLGVDPFVRRRVLNHSLTGIDRVYDQHDYLERKRAALDLWAKHLAEIIDGKTGGENVVPMREIAQ